MKLTILTTFLLGLISLSCLSQIKGNLNISLSDLTPTMDSLQYSIKPLDFKTNQQTTKSLDIDKYLKVPELKDNKDYDFKNNFALLERHNSFDNMPCLKPDIKNRMPVLKPDPTTKYTLLIKKIK